MIPTIFPANYIDTLTYSGNWPEFPLHGTVDLIDCIECVAEQNEDEGSEWELEFTYPQGGYGFSELALDKIILAKANDYQDPQAFRIYSIEKAINKTVIVKAQHISYDMINVPVKTFTKQTSAGNALWAMMTNTIYGNNWKQHHFYFDTDVSQSGEFQPGTPVSMRAMLLDGDDSIKGTFGGDLIFDNYHVTLKSVGGADRDVVINYGVDLIDMTQEDNNSEMITGILPYYKRSTNDEQYETNPIIYGDVVYGPGTYTIQRIEPVDLSEHFPNNVPTVAQITAKAREWVAKEEIGVPEVSLTVQYATLGQDVRIHDAIRVRFPKMGVDTKAKVVKYKYNVLLERCEEIEVGHAKDSNLFSLMDASKLRKGLIPPARIQNESITNNKIARGGIGAGKLAPNSVGSGNVQRHAIDHEQMAEKAVHNDNIDNLAVDTRNMVNGAITGLKIAGLAVNTQHLADLAVKNTKIGDSAVSNTKIGDSAVSTSKIQGEAVTGGSSGKIKRNTITTWDNSSGINTSLAYADTFNATQSAEMISTFYCGTVTATGVYVKSGGVFNFRGQTISVKHPVIDGTMYNLLGY